MKVENHLIQRVGLRQLFADRPDRLENLPVSRKVEMRLAQIRNLVQSFRVLEEYGQYRLLGRRPVRVDLVLRAHGFSLGNFLARSSSHAQFAKCVSNAVRRISSAFGMDAK